MPIINVGFRFLRQSLYIFIRSQNLMDFALDKKKIKQNNKIWLRAVAQWESLPSSPH